MNVVVLNGRIAQDIEYRTTNSDLQVAKFNIGVRNATGKEPKTDYFPVVVYGNSCEFLKKYFSKGSRIAVKGRLNTRNYDDKDGKKVYVTEVVAENVEFDGENKSTEGDTGEKKSLQRPTYSRVDDSIF